MADVVLVPKIKKGKDDWYAKSPAWSPAKDFDGNPEKPIVRCNCGQWSGIGLHHVHADGTVTASFFHATKAQHPQGDDNGCGWHVWIKLQDYDCGDFPPEK
jgi:hypothetical protein